MKSFTLTQLQDHVLFLANIKSHQLDPGNTSTTGLTNLTNLINQWKDRVVESHAYSWRVGRISIATANKFSHDLPSGVQRIVTVFDPSNDRYLREVNLQGIRKYDPGLTTTGTPEIYTMASTISDKRQIGFYPVGSATLEIEYDKSFTDLDDANDILELMGVPHSMMSAFQGAIVQGVLSEVYDHLSKADRSGAALQKHFFWIEQLKENDNPQNEVQELASHARVSRLREARFPGSYPVGA